MSSSGKEGGSLIALGSLYGGFIFSICLVVSNVIYAVGGDIKMPKYAMCKELGFYFISVVVVTIFAFMKFHGYAFVGVYLVVYIAYIICTIIAEKLDGKSEEETKGDNDLEGELS